MNRDRKPAWTLDEHRRFTVDPRRLRDLIGAALADLGGRGGVRAEHIDALLKVHHGIDRAGIYFGLEDRR